MQRAYLIHYDDKNEEKEPQVQLPEQPLLDFFLLVRIPLYIRVYFDITQQPVRRCPW